MFPSSLWDPPTPRHRFRLPDTRSTTSVQPTSPAIRRPLVVTTPANLVYTVGAGPVVADPGVTVTDTTSSFLVGASVAISGYVSGDDHLGFTDTPTITGNFDVVTGILTLTGFDTPANYQAALQSVTYSNTNLINPAPTRTLIFTANDGDPSAGATRLVTIGSVAPVVDLDGSLSGLTSFTSANWNNSAPVNIAAPANATVFDGESPNLTSMTATISTFPHRRRPGGHRQRRRHGQLQRRRRAHPHGHGQLRGLPDRVAYRHVQQHQRRPGRVFGHDQLPGHRRHPSSNVAVATIPIVNAILDLDGVLSAGTGFASTWTNTGNTSVPDAANATVVDGESATMTQLTATMPAVNAGGSLLATNSGNVKAIYTAATRTMTLLPVVAFVTTTTVGQRDDQRRATDCSLRQHDLGWILHPRLYLEWQGALHDGPDHLQRLGRHGSDRH